MIQPATTQVAITLGAPFRGFPFFRSLVQMPKTAKIGVEYIEIGG
jgi:hypothetical protein